MTCQHIGKESYHKRQWFHYRTEYFDDRQKRERTLQHQWYIRPENIFEVVLRSEQIHHEQGEKTENAGHCDISSNVGSSREERNYSKKVIQKYPQEYCAQVRRDFGLVLTDRILRHPSIYHHDNGFHQCSQSRRSFIQGIMATIPTSRCKYKKDK